MPEEIVVQFDKCPACGSKRRFVEGLADEVKDKGWMRPDLNFFANIINGIVRENTAQMEQKIPIGSKVPSYVICLDACVDCGCIYAVKLSRGEAQKTVPLGPNMKIPPGALHIKRN